MFFYSYQVQMVDNKSTGEAGLWVLGEGDNEITKSPKVIKKSLARLKAKRGFVVLLHKGYQSGNTIIIGFDEKYLYIDKPLDWPGLSSKIRMVFKDEAKVWNHFTIKVVGVSKDTLKTIFPTKLFRLQRRANFRLNVLRGSRAGFSRNGDAYRNAEIINISAGGVLLSLDHKGPIIGDHSDNLIQDITMKIVAGVDETSQDKLLTVAKGRVVREVFDQENRRLLLGIEFFVNAKEEKALLKYIRHRELEILRKGIAE